MTKPLAIAGVERVLGRTADSWSPVTGRGYSIAERWLVRLEDGGTAFVKSTTDEDIERRLRAELRVYRSLDREFMPRFLGWDEGPPPVLVLEDLTPGAHWPPPWSDSDIDAVLAILEEIAATPPPDGLPRVEEHGFAGWGDVAANPERFLGLGLCAREWLDAALPTLVRADEAAPLRGERLVHCDVRSDNLCIRNGRPVLFDWNFASVGNPVFDFAFWLPSLTLEGGPPPQEMARRWPGADDFSALVAGFFAALAGLPPPSGAPTVRAFQLAQLEVALPWAVSVLGLEPPG